MLEMFWFTGFYFGTKRDGSIRMLYSSQVLKKTRFWIHLFFIFYFLFFFSVLCFLSIQQTVGSMIVCVCVCAFLKLIVINFSVRI